LRDEIPYLASGTRRWKLDNFVRIGTRGATPGFGLRRGVVHQNLFRRGCFVEGRSRSSKGNDDRKA